MEKSDKPFVRPLVEVTVSATADEAWAALRDPERIRQWFGWDTDSLPDEIEHIFVTHADADDARRVLDMRPDRFEIEDHGPTCVVRVVRPAPTAATDWDEIFDDETQGWIAFVQQLAFMFAHHVGQARRTLYFSGMPQGALALSALGLDAAPEVAGQPWASPIAGEPLAGAVWHRGRHQRGYTVQSWGDGLLVVIDRAPTEARPGGFSQAILTTYGLDDAAFAALESRWSAWWSANFRASPPPTGA